MTTWTLAPIPGSDLRGDRHRLDADERRFVTEDAAFGIGRLGLASRADGRLHGLGKLGAPRLDRERDRRLSARFDRDTRFGNPIIKRIGLV